MATDESRRNKDGYFRSTFYFKGKQYAATSRANQKDADKKAALKLDRMERGEVGLSGRMTVDRWAKEWLETYKRPVVADKQYQDYKRQIEKIIVPEIGKLRLMDVNDVHLQKIMNLMENKSLTRVKKVRNTMCAMFRMARASRLIIFDPAEFIALPKAEEGTHRSITAFEREHFLKAAEGHHAGLMFKVMLYCGLRTGEVVALDWRDIDFEKRRIKVSRAMESGTSRIKEPKTKAGNREIPIPDGIYNELLVRKGDPFEPVFLQKRGRIRHTHSSRRGAWDSIKKQMDISMGAVFEKRKAADGKMRLTKVLSIVAPDFVPYCLRHTYCTDLQDKGVPINMAKYLMGHSDIRVTAGIYTHVTDDAIDGIAALLNPKDDANNDANKNEKQEKSR